MGRLLPPTLVCLALLLLFSASPAHARNPYAFYPPRPERLRAVRYAQMTKKECLAELELREIPHRPLTKAERIKATR